MFFIWLILNFFIFTICLEELKPRRRRKKNKGGESGGAGAKKRKLSAEQVNLLELNFGSEHKLESERKDRLASELGLDPRQVAVWFQNRRARWKNKKLEDEYSSVKRSHDAVVVEKCRLESEVSILSHLMFVCVTVYAHVFCSFVYHTSLTFSGSSLVYKKIEREKKDIHFLLLKLQKNMKNLTQSDHSAKGYVIPTSFLLTKQNIRRLKLDAIFFFR